MRNLSIAIVVGVASLALSGCGREPDECANIHLYFHAPGTLHVGVLGGNKISGSSCFHMLRESTGETVELAQDPVDTDWIAPASELDLSVMESFVADVPQDSYVLSIPASWIDTNQGKRIAFGTPKMNYSDTVRPKDFSGTPPVAYVSATTHEQA